LPGPTAEDRSVLDFPALAGSHNFALNRVGVMGPSVNQRDAGDEQACAHKSFSSHSATLPFSADYAEPQSYSNSPEYVDVLAQVLMTYNSAPAYVLSAWVFFALAFYAATKV
jgi:hypothetical protein